MDFNHAQQALEALQAQCPHTDPQAIDVWIGAITRARETLLELQITNSGNGRAVTARPGVCATGYAARYARKVAGKSLAVT
jgi:hypothetical protein